MHLIENCTSKNTSFIDLWFDRELYISILTTDILGGMRLQVDRKVLFKHPIEEQKCSQMLARMAPYIEPIELLDTMPALIFFNDFKLSP